MRVILTGGGTGGHVLPAVAIAQELKARSNDTELLFIGRKGGDENKEAIKAGIKTMEIDALGLERKLTFKNIKSLFIALKSTLTAKKIIRQFSPDIVVGTGGYVCYPILRAAISLRIPTAIHESNVYPGMVTRMLSPKCDLTLVNHNDTINYLKKARNVTAVGNPIRPSFLKISRESSRRKLGLGNKDIMIVSFGGSGGSKIMNDCICDVMRDFSLRHPEICHLHATGRKYYDEYKGKVREQKRCKILPYIDDMPTYLKSADIVICRAGAITLSEIAALGCAAILIPSPNVTDNHQYKNAKLLADAKAAILIEESNLNSKILEQEILSLIKHPENRKNMSKCIEKFANPSSVKIISELLENLVKKG